MDPHTPRAARFCDVALAIPKVGDDGEPRVVLGFQVEATAEVVDLAIPIGDVLRVRERLIDAGEQLVQLAEARTGVMCPHPAADPPSGPRGGP